MALNMQLVRRRRQQLQKQEEERAKGKHFDEVKEGANKRRILPPWPGSEDWRKYAAYHFNVLDKQAVLCPKKTYNKPCPICDLNEELYKSDDKQDKEDAKKIRAKDRFFCNVLNLDKNDSKVYVMSFGQTVEEQVIAIMDPGSGEEKEGEPAEEFGYGDITDPKNGRTLLITKTVPADPTQTSYEVKAATTSSPIANWEQIAPNLINLDELVAADEYTVDELQAMLDGTFNGKNDSAPANNSTGKTSSNEEFGGKPKQEAPKKEEAKVSESFEAPKGMTPPKQEAPVENSQPPKTMSAIDKLKARKAAQEGK